MKSLKFLLKHDLSDTAVRSLNSIELFVALDFIRILDGHLAAGLNALNIASVGCLKVGLRDQVVDIDELVLIPLGSCR